MIDYLYRQFEPIAKKASFALIGSVSLCVFIIFNNVIGLFPYIFTSSSQLTFTVSLALIGWLSMIIYGWLNNSRNLLTHLIPQGTPVILMPFIVLIETIRNIIRPFTLAIRLTANIIAGHLLIVLLSSAMASSSITSLPLVIILQTMLSLLERAVSVIQAYVFSVLITMYIAEFSD